MSVISRNVYKKIEWHLYHYHQLCREIEEEKRYIIEDIGKDVIEYGKGISYRSDPTAGKALKLCKKDIVQKEKWVHIIEKTIKRFEGTGKDMLIQKKYFDQIGDNRIMNDLHIVQATFYRWKGEIVLYICLLAVQEDLFKI